MPNNQNRAKSIFLNALEKDTPAERRAYIDAECGADEALRHEVQEYLHHHGQMGSFLELANDNPEDTVDDPATGRPGAVVGQYQLLEQIGAGGMGEVYFAEDTALKRNVAIKLLKDPDSPGAARFLKEARITGQLQHPAIPPVHQVGTLGDGQPFLAMKLIEGQTLAVLLKERKTPDEERGRFLAIFEQICQGVGFAHAHDVIHRDLKPSNIMVGAFGEVQVMDWGLAKVLSTSETIEPPQAESESDAPPPANPEQTTDYPPAQESTDVRTRAGQVMGTPAFMPPEQARGENDLVDRRADVFSLGGILFVILTGKPLYSGQSGREVLKKAEAGDLDEAMGQLDSSGADAELIALCKRCLAVHPDDRPRDAAVVAEAVTAYLESVQARMKQAEIASAEAKTKAGEARKRQKITLALAAAILLLVLGAGGAVFGYQHYRNQEQLAAQQDANQLHNLLSAAQQVHDQFDKKINERGGRGVFQMHNDRKGWTDKITQALATLHRAGVLYERIDAFYAGGPAWFSSTEVIHPQVLATKLSDLRKQLIEDQREWMIAAELGEIRERRMTWVGEDFDDGYALENYPKVFKKANLGLFNDDPKIVAKRIRSLRIKEQLIASLDDWAVVTIPRRQVAARLGQVEAKQRLDLRKRLLGVAQLAGSNDPWVQQFRDFRQWVNLAADEAALVHFIDSMPADISPQLVIVLSNFCGEETAALEAWIREARSRYPRDFTINLKIANSIYKQFPDEASGYFRAAIASNPHSSAAYNNWGHLLLRQKQYREAIAKFQKAIDIDQNHAIAYTNWGSALAEQKRGSEAIAKWQKAIECDPNYASAYNNWGIGLRNQGKYEQAIAKSKKAALLDPNSFMAYDNWGVALTNLKKYEEAIAKFQQAIKVNPRYTAAYTNWGVALTEQKKYKEAIAKYQQAITIDPEYAKAYYQWASALLDQKQYPEAIAKLKIAINMDPQYAAAYIGWGRALAEQGQSSEAIAKLKIAVKFDPKNAMAYNNWGMSLSQLKRFPEAIAKLKIAIKLDPNLSLAYANWGTALLEQKHYSKAIAKLNLAIKLDPYNATTYTNCGTALFIQRNYKDALASLEKAISLDPSAAYPYYLCGACLGEQKKYRSAIVKYQQAIARNPNSARAWLALGAIYTQVGDLPRARTAYRKVARINSGDPRIWLDLGFANLRHKQIEDAVAAFDKIVASDPQLNKLSYDFKNIIAAYDTLRIVKPNSFAKTKNFVTWCKKSVSQQPTNAKRWAVLGVALRARGDNAGAAAAHREAVKIQPKFVNAWFNLGNALYAINDDKGAADAYRKVIALNPKDFDAWTGLGDALQRQRDYTGAGVAFESAVTINPRHLGALFNLGFVQRMNGRFEKAIANFNRCENLLPRNDPRLVLIRRHKKFCQHSLALMKRLPLVLKGAKADAAERSALATMCQHYLKRYRDAAQLYAGTMEEVQKRLPASRFRMHRYNAACSAALALAGKGEGSDKISDEEKSKLLQSAFQWLQAELQVRKQTVMMTPHSAMVLDKELQHWQTDPDLAAVRDKKRIAQLPEKERKPWQELWTQVAALQKQVRESYSTTELRGKLTYKDKSDSGRYYREHKIKMEANRSYTMELASEQFDTSLILFDSSGTRRLAANKAATSANKRLSRVNYTPDKSATYILRVTSTRPGRIGAYRLTLLKHRTTTPVVTRLASVLTKEQVEQTLEIKMAANKVYVIDMQSQQFDTFLKVQDADARLLAENDDIDLKAKNLNSRLVFTPAKAGVYRIVATSYQQRGRGNYEIIIREFPSAQK